MLGVPWDKNCDNLSVAVMEFNETLIRQRNVLSYIASIYDPLGLISASSKVIYFFLCLRIFFSILKICTCKHKIYSHQSYIYYDMPGDKNDNNSKKMKL